jgi:hypothetical protein
MADAHWHDGLTRRLRSLLKTQPLHDLRANEGRRASVLPHDDTLALAMRAMEVMVDALGLRAGAPRQELTDALMPLLRFNDAFHNVATDEKRHQAVIAAVLGALLNDGDRRQAYRAEYLEFPNNVPVRRAISYRLAAECEAPDGEIVLRAESDGINLFLRSLDVDLEDAQAAAEAVIRSQLDRGRWDLAAQSAREAQIRSLQFQRKVDELLARTRRDIANVDWDAEMPRLMAEARKHLHGRTDIEREMLAQVRVHLGEAQAADAVTALVHVMDALEDCLKRHLMLHGRLMDAFEVFRAEQERQRFIPLSTLSIPPLEDGLFRPILALPLVEARPVLDAFSPDIHPPVIPRLMDLGDLWDALLRPPRAVPTATRVMDDEDFVALEPAAPPFSADITTSIYALLHGLTERTPLSRVLANALSEEERDFLILRALQHFAPDESPPLPLRAVHNGNSLECGHWRGDDLDLVPEVVTHD